MLCRGWGGGGAFGFLEEFLVKSATLGPKNLGKSDQNSPPWNGKLSEQ